MLNQINLEYIDNLKQMPADEDRKVTNVSSKKQQTRGKADKKVSEIDVGTALHRLEMVLAGETLQGADLTQEEVVNALDTPEMLMFRCIFEEFCQQVSTLKEDAPEYLLFLNIFIQFRMPHLRAGLTELDIGIVLVYQRLLNYYELNSISVAGLKAPIKYQSVNELVGALEKGKSQKDSKKSGSQSN